MKIDCGIFSGIVTVQYCEDELGYIKLTAQPQTNSHENEIIAKEAETPTDNDGQSMDDNILRKSVQYVSKNKRNHSIVIGNFFLF